MHRLLMVPAFAGAALAFATPATAASAHHAPADTQSDYQSGYQVGGVAHSITAVDARWTVPTVTCAPTDDNAAETQVAIGNSDDATAPVQLGVDSACAKYGGTPTAPDYFGFYYSKAKDDIIDNPISPGDTMHGTVSGDAQGTYTLTLADETKKWTVTNTVSSPETTGADAEVGVDNLGTGDTLPLPKFDKAAFSDVTVNGKPLSGAKPVRSTLTDSTGATVTATDLDAKGGFTCSYTAKS